MENEESPGGAIVSIIIGIISICIGLYFFFG